METYQRRKPHFTRVKTVRGKLKKSVTTAVLPVIPKGAPSDKITYDKGGSANFNNVILRGLN